MTVVFEEVAIKKGKVYYNIDCKKLRSLKREYKRAGWDVVDCGEQGRTFVYRKFELY